MSTDRAALRRRLLRWNTPVAVLVGLAGVKLLVMTGAGTVAQASFVVGNHDAAARAAAVLDLGNVVERYKAPFAAGTVRAAQAETMADLRAAEALLREALDLARGTEECAVRYNLALVVEAQGDATDDEPAAEALFREASAIAADAPDECRLLPSLTDAEAPDDAAEPSGGGDGEGQDGDEGGDGGQGGEGDTDAESGDGGAEGGREGDAEGDGSGEDSPGDAAGKTGGREGRSAADDLREAATRSRSKADRITEMLGQAPESSEEGGEEQLAEDGAADQPSPLSDHDRSQELQDRMDRSSTRQVEISTGRAVERPDAAPGVASPW